MGKYKFNKEKLEFVEVKRGKGWWGKKLIKYLFSSLLLAVLYYFVISLFYNTDYQRRLVRENKLMEQEYALLQEKLEVLDNTVANLKIKDREIYRSIFNAEPPMLHEYLNAPAFIGDIDTLRSNNLVHLSAESLESAQKRASAVSEGLNNILASITSQGSEVMNLPSIVPLANFSVGQSGASVGKKINPFYKTVVEHTGIDLLAAVGTDVVATADGIAELVKRSSRDGGNTVIINHENGYQTIYSHLGDILVRRGKRVKRGEVIGRVGNTGLSFAPHLHYEIRLRGEVVDPVNYFFATLTHEQYFAVVSKSANTGQSLD